MNPEAVWFPFVAFPVFGVIASLLTLLAARIGRRIRVREAERNQSGRYQGDPFVTRKSGTSDARTVARVAQELSEFERQGVVHIVIEDYDSLLEDEAKAALEGSKGLASEARLMAALLAAQLTKEDRSQDEIEAAVRQFREELEETEPT